MKTTYFSCTRSHKRFQIDYRLWLEMTSKINCIVQFCSISLNFNAFYDEYTVYVQYAGLFQKSGTYFFLLDVIA